MNKIIVVDGYVIATANTPFDTDENADAVELMLQRQPSAPTGYVYKLRADNLERELVELPPVESEPMTDEEALTRYANSITGADDPDLISAAETLITERIKEES